MQFLIFGKSGQVARELACLPIEARFLSREDVDLERTGAAEAAILAHKPDAVINAAAWTNVDGAETDEARATLVNGLSPTEMARATATLNIPFVHLSTDYVFDGTGVTGFDPEDATNPLGAYGRSKLAGETGVQDAGLTYAILRTSWVFSSHGSNFVKTMLRLSETKDTLTIVADQIGGPTPAAEIAAAAATMAQALARDPLLTGLYHFSGRPDVSWADFARAIFRLSDRKVTVSDIATADYPTPAARPANSRGRLSRLRRATSTLSASRRA